jgi:hypothetical protein
MTRTRAEYLADLTDDIRALTVEVRTSAEYAVDGTTGQRRHRVRHPALLAQLVAALGPGAPTAGGRSGKPGSGSPVNESVSGTLDDIRRGWAVAGAWQIGAFDLATRLRVAAGKRPGRRVELTGTLYAVRSLAHMVEDPDLIECAADAARAYVALAKRTLVYEAPQTMLRDVSCPACRGPLRVAVDASSDVWCPSATCRDPEGRRHIWPRSSWGLLLERLAAEQVPV